jgi:hypothetical protein
MTVNILEVKVQKSVLIKILACEKHELIPHVFREWGKIPATTLNRAVFLQLFFPPSAVMLSLSLSRSQRKQKQTHVFA